MRTVITLLTVVMLVGPALAQDGRQDVPVTHVVLFSSGVGYFEHVGQVEGDAEVQLMFTTEQINDVLKSMVVLDGAGGVSRISYPSRDPLTRALQSFAVDLSGDPTMAELLGQLRGAEVIVFAPQEQQGQIIGVEKQQKKVLADGATTLITETLLNLATPGGIRAVPVSSIQRMELMDERLAAELDKALELLMNSHDTQRKPVEIHFTGKDERRVRIGYIVETPIWKTSYRLDLTGDQPLLQGWAIVENTSDQDWSDVRLSLVSGRPISFVQDLYTPLYVPRPVVEPELYASLVPPDYAEGLAGNKQAPEEEMARRKGRAPGAAPQAAREIRGRDAAGVGTYGDRLLTGEAQSRLSLDKGVASVAQAGEVGELFRYTIDQPVDLARRRSAMLPIINARIEAEKLSIYNQSVLQKHPLNGVRLTNPTEMTMMGGPVTVFAEGAYAGDARIDNLSPGDERLLSYAIDLNVLVDPSQKSDSNIVGVKIVRGTLILERRREYAQTYAIKNKADDNRTLIVEHPRRGGRKLLRPDTPLETTPELYRFRVEVPADETKEFIVAEEQIQRQTIVLLRQSPDALVGYTKSGEIDPKVREALAKVIEMKREIERLESQRRQLQQQRKRIEDGQERLRRNIQTVGSNSQLGQRYIETLGQQEDQLEDMAKQIEELRKQIDQAKTKLEQHLKKLNIG